MVNAANLYCKKWSVKMSKTQPVALPPKIDPFAKQRETKRVEKRQRLADEAIAERSKLSAAILEMEKERDAAAAALQQAGEEKEKLAAEIEQLTRASASADEELKKALSTCSDEQEKTAKEIRERDAQIEKLAAEKDAILRDEWYLKLDDD